MSLQASPAESATGHDLSPPDDATPAPGPFAVGFQLIRFHDRSRSYHGTQDRPLPIAVWYPARSGLASPMRYADYVDLVLEEELTGPPSAEALASNRKEWAAFLAGMTAPEADGEALLGSSTGAVKDAPPAQGRFPLVVYGPGADGEAFEGSVLFELLASHGYVVAAAPSTGTFRHPMDAQHPRGLETQARDLETVMARMHDHPAVDWSRTALVGWSWGGLAALLVPMRDARIDAVVSLDGSVAMHAATLERSPWLDPGRFRAPALFFATSETAPRVVPFLDRVHYADTWLVEMSTLTHGDFASYGYLARRSLAEPSPELRALRDGYAWMAATVLDFLDEVLGERAGGLEAELEEGTVRGVVAAWQHRAPLPAPPVEEELLGLVASSGVAAAVAAFEKARAADPGYVMFREYELVEVAFDLHAEGRNDEAVELMNLAVEADPSSFTAHGYLARLAEYAGRFDEALAHFGQALGLALAAREDDPRAQGNVEWYRKSVIRVRDKLRKASGGEP